MTDMRCLVRGHSLTILNCNRFYLFNTILIIFNSLFFFFNKCVFGGGGYGCRPSWNFEKLKKKSK